MTDPPPLLAQLPTPSEDSRPFWDACNRQQLLLQRCGACAHVFYYARRLCPACGGTQLQWQAASGLGTVYSHSQIQLAFQGPQWQSQLPYSVVLIDLQEGPRMLSRWVGAQPPLIGQAAQVAFVQVDRQWLPFFSSAEGRT